MGSFLVVFLSDCAEASVRTFSFFEKAEDSAHSHQLLFSFLIRFSRLVICADPLALVFAPNRAVVSALTGALTLVCLGFTVRLIGLPKPCSVNHFSFLLTREYD